MSDFVFAEPGYVHLLWAVLAAGALLFALERRGGHALFRFVGEVLQARLVAAPSRARRLASWLLLVASAALLVVALMRPQWGGEFVETSSVGAEIMIALDVSKSMLAEDTAPNRLERAKAEIRDLLAYLDGNQVGLIAFAGRASVVSPLTPDFGFLRLVLDQVSSATVRLGGTRLEEPIRKAVAGFGAEGDVSRVLLLITDGEDQDSFPRDAAELAAERGVRILAVGLGDETGSEIRITDPDTGARTVMRDAEGRPVISRLDGELLRDLALTTEGAYVPAGTGVLDLESIYTAHIAPLMRRGGETRGRTVRKEAYQWAVLLALLALLTSVGVRASGAAAPRGTAAIAAVVCLAASPARAAEDPDLSRLLPSGPAAVASTGEVPRESDSHPEAADAPVDPREAYNQALAALESGALDDAERRFEEARNGAGVDGEVRFRATYNRGWVEVERAERRLAAEPEAALASLKSAAEWFRAATVLRPGHVDARRNLEIVLQRATALADSLAAEDSLDLTARLDALIERQRAAVSGARELVQAEASLGGSHAGEALRGGFRAAEVEARAMLADAGELAESGGRELDAIAARPAEERTPEDELRHAQIEALLRHLHRGREKVGQARQQLRQRQAGRSHRRVAAGLDAFKRARDQLRDPVQILEGLLADAGRVAADTGLLAAADDAALGEAVSPPPAWLDAPGLEQSQADVADRTEELDARLEAGLQAAAAQPAELSPMLQAVLDAEPFVREAQVRGRAAEAALGAGRVAEAREPQRAALMALAEARERFLDLPGLIEAAASDERRIDAVLSASDASAASLAEYADALVALQLRNVERATRMAPHLDHERAALAAGDDPAVDPTQAAAQLARLEQAGVHVAKAESLMRGAAAGLGSLGDGAQNLEATRTSVDGAVRELDELRRLFMTLVQQLRETAHRQQQLGDRTEAAAAGASADPQLAAALGPVRTEQGALGDRADELAEALHAQSFLEPAEGGADPEALREQGERYALAAERVLAAGEAMGEAAVAMEAEPAALDVIRPPQETALTELAAALEILEPPQPDSPPESDDEGGESEESQQQESSPGEGDEEETEPEEAEADPTRLLQQVRDREARRHREQASGGRIQAEPVERDW